MTVVEFGLLGEVRAGIGDRAVDLGHARQRCVLAALLVDLNRPVPADELLDRVWADKPPHRARNTLSGYLSRLRHLLAGADGVRIARGPAGYVLAADPATVDLHRFRDLVARARRAAPGEAAELLTTASGLWRGEPFATLDTPWLNDVRAALDAERLAAELDRRDLALGAGRHAELVGELAAQAATHPLDERVAGQLMLALNRSGRQADALAAYQRVRRLLADELGVDPGLPLRQLHQQILTGDKTVGAASVSRPARRPDWPLVPRQLPAPPRSFVGRDTELAELDDVLATAGDRASTVVVSALSGTAGVGKTALALHWAHRVASRFADGQLYVNLRGFDPGRAATTPAEAVRGFLDAFQVPPERIPMSLEAQCGLYRSLLADRRVLVVLDNARDAEQVRPLLPGASGCMSVVTSRNQLTGLVAAEGATPVPLDLLGADESRAVLADRIGAARMAAEPAAVDEIVERCAGLPLALAIVAARAVAGRRSPLAALADQLRDARDRLDVFAVGDAMADVRAVFSWSYAALDVAPARLFRLIGLHPGPDLTAPAAAALAGLPVAAVTALLRQLVDAHLVAEQVPGRYAVHDLLRVYAAELVERDDADERRAARHGMFDHYLQTADLADGLLYPHRDPVEPPRRCPGVGPAALRGPEDAMAWFVAEAPVLLALGPLALATGFDPYSWHLLRNLVNVLDRRRQWPSMVGPHEEALAAARRLGDRPGEALVLRGLARAGIAVGRLDDVRAYGERALEVYAGLGDLAGQAQTHLVISAGYAASGENAEAARHAEEGLRNYRAAGHRAGEANALNNLGWILAQLGRPREALTHCGRALALQQEVGDRLLEGMSADSLGYAHHLLGEFDEAVVRYRQAIEVFQEQGARFMEAESWDRMASSLLALGRAGDARAAWQQALEVYDEHGDPEADRLRDRIAAAGAATTPRRAR